MSRAPGNSPFPGAALLAADAVVRVVAAEARVVEGHRALDVVVEDAAAIGDVVPDLAGLVEDQVALVIYAAALVAGGVAVDVGVVDVHRAVQQVADAAAVAAGAVA